MEGISRRHIIRWNIWHESVLKSTILFILFVLNRQITMHEMNIDRRLSGCCWLSLSLDLFASRILSSQVESRAAGRSSLLKL